MHALFGNCHFLRVILHVYANVHAVEKRGRKFLPILTDCLRAAQAQLVLRAIVPARTWICREQKLESGGINRRASGSAYCYRACLNRYAEHLQHCSAKFCGLVQKKHSVMRERNFSGSAIHAPATYAFKTCALMRHPERGNPQQRLVCPQKPRN